MIDRIFVLALRNFQRQLTYSLINIFGLAIGIACSLVMFLYVYSEWSYDRHFAHADRIFRIGSSFFNLGGFAVSAEALGEYLPKDYEGVEAFTQIKSSPGQSVRVRDNIYNELVFYTDSSFYKVFSYEFVEGDPKTALTGPHKMVVTESMAKKLFGSSSAIGEVVLVGKENDAFTVTAIVKDDRRSSQLKSEIWLSLAGKLTKNPSWFSVNLYSYVLLRENQEVTQLEDALKRIVKKWVFTQSAGGVPPGLPFDEYEKHENSYHFIVHRLTDVHLKSKLNYEISEGGNEATIFTFVGISIFILLLATVNFINLTTARASRRAKEVAVRKTVGSSREKLIAQFTAEAIFLSMAAMFVSLLLAELFLMLFEMITGSRLLETLWASGWSYLIVLIIALVVGFLSGIYPAFYLTSFNPVRVLKGQMSIMGGGRIRNLLVIFQFSISIGLMICYVVIMQQINFMQDKDLGFNPHNIVVIDNTKALKTHQEAFRNDLMRFQGVVKSSAYNEEPGNKSIVSVNTFQQSKSSDVLSINTYFGDADFIELMGFHLLRGRTFNKDLSSDSTAVVLNESAVNLLGLENPVGTNLKDNIHVIGVVSDFNFESLRNPVAPTAIMLGTDYQRTGFMVRSGAMSAFLKAAENKWKELAADDPFTYHFLEDNFEAILKNERIIQQAIGFFSLLAVLISCLGLYGLSAYTAESRTKEIGIRKVMGATSTEILIMLNRQFARLVIIAIVFSLPVSMFVMQDWLQTFAYRIEPKLWMLVLTVALSFVIAITTVSFHALKAARINPAESIKYE